MRRIVEQPHFTESYVPRETIREERPLLWRETTKLVNLYREVREGHFASQNRENMVREQKAKRLQTVRKHRMTEKLYNVTQLATVLKCCTNTAYVMLRENRIRHARVGNRFRVTESAVSEFLRGGAGSGATSGTTKKA
jgi:excisionase family DNA binding protein